MRPWARFPFSRIRSNRRPSSRNFERRLIRIMVLAAVLLVIVQLGQGLVRDPVDFYIAMAQKVEVPPLEVQSTSGLITPELEKDKNAAQNWKITLKAIPAAPVRVLQNGKLIGTLTRGELTFFAQSGTLQLDGSACSQIVRVQVTERDLQLREPKLNQSVTIEKNIKSFRITP